MCLCPSTEAGEEEDPRAPYQYQSDGLEDFVLRACGRCLVCCGGSVGGRWRGRRWEGAGGWLHNPGASQGLPWPGLDGARAPGFLCGSESHGQRYLVPGCVFVREGGRSHVHPVNMAPISAYHTRLFVGVNGNACRKVTELLAYRLAPTFSTTKEPALLSVTLLKSLFNSPQ